jgi:hypothetical protein
MDDVTNSEHQARPYVTEVTERNVSDINNVPLREKL